MKVLINGGSRGIGAEMVRLFSKNGHSVAFTYKNSKEKAERLANECDALAIYADSSATEDVNRAVSIAVDVLGEVDVLINNAAISAFSLLTDVTDEEWSDMMSVNIDGAFRYSRAVLPFMIRKKFGRIINISSMWGICGSSCEVAYSTSKAALIGFTKALAKEVGPSNITVNCIAPGLIDTEMNAVLSDSDKQAIIEETPISRIGRAEDVARTALFLSSNGADFITGAVISVNGGLVM